MVAKSFNQVFSVPANKADYGAELALGLPDGYVPMFPHKLWKRDNAYVSLNGWEFSGGKLYVYLGNSSGSAMTVRVQATVLAAKVQVI